WVIYWGNCWGNYWVIYWVIYWVVLNDYVNFECAMLSLVVLSVASQSKHLQESNEIVFARQGDQQRLYAR
ncbi:MAG: hypothetical protein ACI9G1_004173, partial [Pirellulaceae bacterium]